MIARQERDNGTKKIKLREQIVISIISWLRELKRWQGEEQGQQGKQE